MDIAKKKSDFFSFRRNRKTSENGIKKNVFYNKPKNQPTFRYVNETEYRMNNKRRGKALVFNFQTFEKKNLSRPGSEEDLKKIRTAFSLLHFEVEVHKDLKKKQFTDVLKKVSQEDHSDADCLAVVIMSHGENEKIQTYDRWFRLDKLWGLFSPKNCFSLAGKPKLFFIQACRGAKTDRGFSLNFETDASIIERVNSSIPQMADFLICQATVEGYKAVRDPIKGSWFIEVLSLELIENGFKYDLLQIMTNVNRKVALDYYSTDEDNLIIKEMPIFSSTLLRSVRFRPRPRPRISRETIV